MDKIKVFVGKYQYHIMAISLLLMVTGCCIVGLFEMNPWWYLLCFFLGLGILIPFCYVVVKYLIVCPIEKLIEKIKKWER